MTNNLRYKYNVLYSSENSQIQSESVDYTCIQWKGINKESKWIRKQMYLPASKNVVTVVVLFTTTAFENAPSKEWKTSTKTILVSVVRRNAHSNVRNERANEWNGSIGVWQNSNYRLVFKSIQYFPSILIESSRDWELSPAGGRCARTMGTILKIPESLKACSYSTVENCSWCAHPVLFKGLFTRDRFIPEVKWPGIVFSRAK